MSGAQHIVPVQGSLNDPKTTLGQGVNMLKGGGGIFKSAAAAVLRIERRLMTTGEITKWALLPYPAQGAARYPAACSPELSRGEAPCHAGWRWSGSTSTARAGRQKPPWPLRCTRT